MHRSSVCIHTIEHCFVVFDHEAGTSNSEVLQHNLGAMDDPAFFADSDKDISDNKQIVNAFVLTLYFVMAVPSNNA